MEALILKKTECACERCQRGCTNTPGWFRPGEAERAAELMGLSLRKFFKKYLMVNWWEDSIRGHTFVLSPALVGEKPGAEFPAKPNGACVFYLDGKCAIHAAKPFDCSHGNLCEDRTPQREQQHMVARKITVRLWKKQQGQITELLGREPRAARYSFLDAMFW